MLSVVSNFNSLTKRKNEKATSNLIKQQHHVCCPNLPHPILPGKASASIAWSLTPRRRGSFWAHKTGPGQQVEAPSPWCFVC